MVLLRLGAVLLRWNADILFPPALQLLLCFSTLVSELCPPGRSFADHNTRSRADPNRLLQALLYGLRPVERWRMRHLPGTSLPVLLVQNTSTRIFKSLQRRSCTGVAHRQHRPNPDPGWSCSGARFFLQAVWPCVCNLWGATALGGHRQPSIGARDPRAAQHQADNAQPAIREGPPV